MNKKEKNSNKTEKEKLVTDKKTENKFIAIIKNNKVATILGITLLIVFVWFFVKLRVNESSFKKEKDQIITTYENRLYSLRLEQLKFATEVFSWSVRSELLRENSENLNQLLTVFVQESGSDLVQLLDPKNNTILLSSDKKFEGKIIDNADYTNLTSTEVLNKGNIVKIICPVMGFNEIIGVLIVEFKTKLSKTEDENGDE